MFIADKPYVYELVDPRDNQIFYVGKGRRDRAYHHERDVRRGRISNIEKTVRIASILAAGFSVTVNIVSIHDLDVEAGKAEIARISEIGIENLTNLLPGGWWFECDGLHEAIHQDAGKLVLKVLDLLTRLKLPANGEPTNWFKFFVIAFKDILAGLRRQLKDDVYNFIVAQWFAERENRKRDWLDAVRAEAVRRGLPVAS